MNFPIFFWHSFDIMALNKKYVDQVTPEQVIKIYAEAEIALDVAEEELWKEKLAGSNPNG